MINRHDRNCNSWRHKKDCDCGVVKNDPHWYKKKLAIVEKLEIISHEFFHYQRFGKLVEKVIKKHLPDYSVSVDEKSLLGEKFNIWGNGLRYDDGVGFVSNQKEDWQDRFKHYLARDKKFLQDSLAQILIEETMEEPMQAIDNEVKRLIGQARKMMGGNISFDFGARFPVLFKTDID